MKATFTLGHGKLPLLLQYLKKYRKREFDVELSEASLGFHLSINRKLRGTSNALVVFVISSLVLAVGGGSGLNDISSDFR